MFLTAVCEYGRTPHVIVTSTHQSWMDFQTVSYKTFSSEKKKTWSQWFSNLF